MTPERLLKLRAMERPPQSNSRDQVFAELAFSPRAIFVGADKWDMEDDNMPEGHVFYGEIDEERVVLKTDNFNGDSPAAEVALVEELRGRLGDTRYWDVPQVIKSGPDYVVYEMLDGMPLAKDNASWERGHMHRVMEAIADLDERLNHQPVALADRQSAMAWVKSHVGDNSGQWVRPALESGVLTTELWQKTTDYLERHAAELHDVARIYRDPNGTHFLDRGDRLGVVDIDISYRPRGYMPMRYLAWSLLNMSEPQRNHTNTPEWIRSVRFDARLGDEYSPTFILSLLGTLYDLSTWDKDHANRGVIALEIRNAIESIIDSDGDTQVHN